MRSKQTETVSLWSMETKKKKRCKDKRLGGKRGEVRGGGVNTRAQRGADETKLNEEHVPHGQRLASFTQNWPM